MKQYTTQAAITPLTQENVSMKGAEKGVLIFDEKHLRFGYFNVAYRHIKSAFVVSEGPLLRKKYYLVICDNHRRYQFGPFRSKHFFKTLPITLSS